MKKHFEYQLINDGNVVNVKANPHPDWDEFEQFVEIFIENEGASIVAQDIGMDRHQVRYRRGDKQYILQFEHYTNSIWIDSDF